MSGDREMEQTLSREEPTGVQLAAVLREYAREADANGNATEARHLDIAAVQVKALQELRADFEWLDDPRQIHHLLIRTGRNMIGVRTDGWLWSRQIDGPEERADTFQQAVRAARLATKDSAR
jgi:hypothetical protein